MSPAVKALALFLTLLAKCGPQPDPHQPGNFPPIIPACVEHLELAPPFCGFRTDAEVRWWNLAHPDQHISTPTVP